MVRRGSCMNQAFVEGNVCAAELWLWVILLSLYLNNQVKWYQYARWLSGVILATLCSLCNMHPTQHTHRTGDSAAWPNGVCNLHVYAFIKQTTKPNVHGTGGQVNIVEDGQIPRRGKNRDWVAFTICLSHSVHIPHGIQLVIIIFFLFSLAPPLSADSGHWIQFSIAFIWFIFRMRVWVRCVWVYLSNLNTFRLLHTIEHRPLEKQSLQV